jgi:hypothetical protein
MVNFASGLFLKRRVFLRLGAIAGVLGVAGCGESGVQEVTTIPDAGGNRRRLEKFKDRAEEAISKKKKN